jgi:SAM-dependent methyltransferase
VKQWQKTMREDWDAMASQNAHYYVLTWDDFADPERIDETQFFDTGRAVVDNMLEALHITPRREWKVLEIGSGLGRLTRRLAELSPDTIGVDVSPAMVEKARRLTPSIRFDQVSGVNLAGFADSTFDLVFSFVVLQHLPSARLTLNYVSEMARVLKPGGLAAFQAATTLSSPWRSRLTWSGRRRHRDPNIDRPSFRGSVVDTGVLQKHAESVGLYGEVVLFAGTPFTYYRMLKVSADMPAHSDFARLRTAAGGSGGL